MAQTIAVYGSSAVQPTDSVYQDSKAIGYALGQAGFTVMTGGYGGVMAAASEGASQADATVIGVTSDTIEAIRKSGPNQWVQQIVSYPTLTERLLHLIREADGYVVMPGGIGTLNELILAWELLRINEIPARPLVCYGDYWRDGLVGLRNSSYIPDVYWSLLTFADSPQAVVAALREGLV